ncbi:MAG TPA: hypothetical protein VH309_13425 [Elusimicrobiota bacterium]|nr:hypothetical protein [Elusimicrobiota bacterium]
MEYEFRLPDGGAFAVKSWGNLAVELAAALAGVKPVIHCWIQDCDQDYVRSLCAAFGLRSFVYARQGTPGAERLGIMLGRDAALLEEAARVWTSPRSNPGPQLGYPPCCSEFYCAWLDDPSSEAGPDVIARIFANTRSPRKLPFLLNDAYYHYSRRGKPADGERREAVSRLNPGLDMNVLNVLPWHPCSYRCAASLAAGRKIWATMLERAPALAAAIAPSLARPVVFWDWDRFAALEGESAPGSCAYTAVAPPLSALGAEEGALLKAGDRLKHRAGRSLEVWAGRKKLGELPGAFLLDFAAD